MFLQSGTPPPEDHATVHKPEREPEPEPQITTPQLAAASDA